MFNATKRMDHDAYPRSLRMKTRQELEFIVADAGEAMRANPTNPNAGFYADEVLYAAAELRRRDTIKQPKRRVA